METTAIKTTDLIENVLGSLTNENTIINLEENKVTVGNKVILFNDDNKNIFDNIDNLKEIANTQEGFDFFIDFPNTGKSYKDIDESITTDIYNLAMVKTMQFLKNINDKTIFIYKKDENKIYISIDNNEEMLNVNPNILDIIFNY